MAVAPKKTPAKVLTPAEKKAAQKKAMVASLQSSLNNGTATGVVNGKKPIMNSIDSGIGTGIVNSRTPLRNPVPDALDSLHQTGNLPRGLKNQGANPASKPLPTFKGKPKIEDPALPPTDSTGGGATTPTTTAPPPTSTKGPVPKEWSAIVDYYFPQGGTGYKAGGLVRGGGAATKGRGRGRIV